MPVMYRNETLRSFLSAKKVTQLMIAFRRWVRPLHMFRGQVGVPHFRHAFSITLRGLYVVVAYYLYIRANETICVEI